MKILLHDETPAYLVHGGKQVHAQKLFENLSLLGVDVEYARWWDPTQKCDLVHSLGCSQKLVWAAQQAGIKLVLTQIVSETNNPPVSRICRRFRNQAIRSLHSDRISSLFSWYFFPNFDALVYMYKFDLEVAISIYGVPREKTHVIPHGCEEDLISRLQLGIRNEHSYLVCMAGIIPRKNSVLLAKAAKLADVPVVFLGKPFNEMDAYYLEFKSLVDGKSVIYPGQVSGSEKERWLKEASGFVLLSKHESGCLVIYEASAAGLPLLLSDLPWAYAYGEHPAIQHVKLNDVKMIANHLKSFFDNSKRLNSLSFPVLTWKEIARQYIDVYTSVLDSGIS